MIVFISSLGQPLTRTFPDVLNLDDVLMAHPTVEPGPLHCITGVGDEQTDAVGGEDLVPGIDPDITTLVLPRLHRNQDEVESREADLRHFLETEAHEGGRERLPEDDLVGGLEVLLLPSRHLLSYLEITRSDDITRQGEETRGQARLSQHSVSEENKWERYRDKRWLKSYLISLRQTAWSSRFQSQPGILRR